MGGGIALLVSLKLLERSHPPLAALVLISSIAFPQRKPFFIRALTLPLIAKLALTLLPATLSVEIVLRQAYFDQAKMERDAVAAYAVNLRDAGGIDAMIEVAKQVVPENLHDIVATYGNITVPTLILWGSNDRIVALENGRRLHQALRHSKLRVIERCGHLPHEEVPAAAIEAIFEFLLERG